MAVATKNTLHIELKGKEYTIKPTLEVYEKVENFKFTAPDGSDYEGIAAIGVCVQTLKLQNIADVFMYLGDIKKSRQTEIKQGIFEAGVGTVGIAISEFISGLLNPSGQEELEKKEDDAGE